MIVQQLSDADRRFKDTLANFDFCNRHAEALLALLPDEAERQTVAVFVGQEVAHLGLTGPAASAMVRKVGPREGGMTDA